MTILLTQINEGDRARKDYGDLTGIKESLSRLGTIHPIVLSKTSTGYDLVAGGRRYRSLKELGVTELHHASVLRKDAPGFLFEDEVPIDVQKEAELDENLYRLDTKWHEDVLLVADVHAAKKEKEPKWGQRQTAALLGKGYGLANVNHAIRLANLLRSGDKEIRECETMTDAIALLIKRKEDEALAELQRRGLPTIASTSSFLDVINIKLGKRGDVTLPNATQLTATATTAKNTEAEPVSLDGSLVQSDAPVIVPLSKMFVRGDCIATMSEMPDSCIDHVVTDIPFGIDMGNLDTIKNISDVESEHEVEANLELMRPFLKQSFRLTKSGGFCVFFYDLDHHEKLQSWATAVGWRVQRWPLIFHKTSSCQNNAAQYNTTKNYEVAMILRRDEKTVLRKQVPSSVFVTDFSTERRLYNNPFCKPFDAWRWLYEMISFPGQTVLDPFCGEMSACRAAVNCGLIPFGVEINEQHFNRGLEHMKKVYALMHTSNCIFT